jgi:hypothetical protein
MRLFIIIAFQVFFRICYQERLEVNGAHHLLVYADSVTILGGNINTTKKKTLSEAIREANLEVNTEE